jgi:hypothetical protein
VIALRRARVGGAGVREYCELDRWSFDPRYTEGRCPICGWRPEGAPSAPLWLSVARRVEWELIGLVALLIVLVVLAVVVARAAGIAVPLPQAHQGGAAPITSPPVSTASPATGATAPVHGTRSPVHK